jgi:hypothetical protein
MSRAHREYRFIRRHSTDPEVHGPYFEALLSLQMPRHLRRAAESMCELPSMPFQLRWNSLVLLALYNTTPAHRNMPCVYVSYLLLKTYTCIINYQCQKSRPRHQVHPIDKALRHHLRPQWSVRSPFHILLHLLWVPSLIQIQLHHQFRYS